MEADFRDGQKWKPRKHDGSHVSKMEANLNWVYGGSTTIFITIGICLSFIKIDNNRQSKNALIYLFAPYGPLPSLPSS